MLLPAVLGKVRANGVEHDELGFDKLEEGVGVCFSFLSNEVVFFESLDFVEAMLESLLVLDIFVSFGSLFNGLIHLIVQDLVPDVIF